MGREMRRRVRRRKRFARRYDYYRVIVLTVFPARHHRVAQGQQLEKRQYRVLRPVRHRRSRGVHQTLVVPQELGFVMGIPRKVHGRRSDLSQ